MKLHIFNSSHDLAMANNDVHFLPPRAVRQMEHDLGLLPLWYANDGEMILTDEGFFVIDLEHRSCNEVVSLPNITSVSPWGWNPQVSERLRKVNLPTDLMLNDNQIQTIRLLSSRKTATECLLHLRNRGYEWMCGEATFCASEEETNKAITKTANTMIKAPWSGSGRGLRFGQGRFSPPLSGWCRNVLKQQEAIVVEPRYNKIVDFALEFESDGKGKVDYIGLSYFDSSDQGTYCGNIIAPEYVLRKKLEPRLCPEKFDVLCSELETWLSQHIGSSYNGVLGVDCMLCCEEGNNSVLVHPCVEINLRQTMGYLSLCLLKWLAPGVEARFSIDYSTSGIRSSNYSGAVLDDNQLLIEGCMPLTAIYSDTQYCAKLEVVSAPIDGQS